MLRDTRGSSVIGELVKRQRQAMRLTQVQLGARTGLTQDYISKLERGTIDLPQRGTLEALAGPLGLTVADLYRAAGVTSDDGQSGNVGDHSGLRSMAYAPMPITVPVYDQPVSAGKGTPSIQQYLYFSPDSAISPGWYGLPVIGSCMVPHLFEGDVVVVNPDGVAEPGDMVVAEIDHEQALVKWFAKHRGQLFIEPERGDRVPFDPEHVRIVGVVMKMWRDVRRKPRREIMRAAQE